VPYKHSILILLKVTASILPGIFYWKISHPESDNRHLLKDDDDTDEEGGLKEQSWKQKLLRRGALGLACYGAVVMVTCLTLNIFFNVAH